MFVHLETQDETLYARVGGEAFFISLVDRFFAGIEGEPVVRSLYPVDLDAPKRHLALFLMQYWGGPGTYSEQRGHPRLRMRHMRFRIGPREREAWLRHMLAAVNTSPASPGDLEALRSYFETAATSLMNQPG